MAQPKQRFGHLLMAVSGQSANSKVTTKPACRLRVKTGFMVGIQHLEPERVRTKLLSALAHGKEACTLHDPLVTGGEGLVPSCREATTQKPWLQADSRRGNLLETKSSRPHPAVCLQGVRVASVLHSE